MNRIKRFFKKRPLIPVENKAFHEDTIQLLRNLNSVSCPLCRGGVLQKVSDAVFQCDGCDSYLNLEHLNQDIRHNAYDFDALAVQQRSLAIKLFVLAQVLLIFCAAWALHMNSAMTLVGGFLIACFACSAALVAHYRSWQLRNRRLFERKTPFRDYVSDMLRRGRS